MMNDKNYFAIFEGGDNMEFSTAQEALEYMIDNDLAGSVRKYGEYDEIAYRYRDGHVSIYRDV